MARQFAVSKCNNLTRVNDSAERAIALYQKYKDNLIVEKEKSNLIQLVENNRRTLNKMRRTDIVNTMLLQPDLNDEDDNIE